MEFTPADRRLVPDRRNIVDRRRVVRVVVEDRRSGEDRRAGAERRGADAPGDHIHTALRLLTNVAESGTMFQMGPAPRFGLRSVVMAPQS